MFKLFNLPSGKEIEKLKKDLLQYLDLQSTFRSETLREQPDHEALLIMNAQMVGIEKDFIRTLSKVG